MTNIVPPTSEPIMTLPPPSKVKRLYRLQNTTLMNRMMPQLQHRLLEMVRRWGGGDDDILLSEREVKIMTHLIGVLEKIIAIEERARTMVAQKTTAVTHEVRNDLEPLRDALAARLQIIIDANTAPDFSELYE